MAKRRNAPALFELLRDSNSTRSGQIGGEQLRTQLGGGTVKNSAPRPPGHPALKEEASKPLEPTPIAAQVATESVVESKQAGETDRHFPGSEVDPLLAMPSFKAGRAVAAKPEPTTETKPEPEIPSGEVDPQPVERVTVTKAPEPEMKPVVVKPTPEPAARKAKFGSKPGHKAPGFGDRAEPAPDSKSESPSDDASPPEETQLAPEDVPQKSPLMRRVGNQMTFSTFSVGMIVTAIPVIILVAYLIGTVVGGDAAKKDVAPLLREQADSSLSGLDGQPRPNNGAEDRPIDPMKLAQDPAFKSPEEVVPVPPPVGQGEQSSGQGTAEPETQKPIQITNEDTRIVGQNYLHLAPLADPEEARRLQAFFAENGVASYIREVIRGGVQGYEVITLVGIPSEGWSTNTRKIDHATEVKRLGGIWFKDYGGSIDFSRDNQSQWYNLKE